MLIWTNFSGHRSEPDKCVIMQPKPLANLKSTYVKWIRKLQAPFLRSPWLMLEPKPVRVAIDACAFYHKVRTDGG